VINVVPIAAVAYRRSVTSAFFWLAVLLGTVGLWVMLFIPFFTFKEDVKMYKDVSCAVVLTASLATALVSASRVIDEEFESRTSVTLLSKPVRDVDLLLGKYLGVLGTALSATALLTASLLICCYLRLGGDDFWRARGASRDSFLGLLDDQWMHFLSLLPCVALIVLETTLLAAFSTMLSTRLSLAPNLVLSAGLFIVGHLTPVAATWTDFVIDDAAVGAMRRNEPPVPEEIIGRLAELRNRRFSDEAAFREAVARHLRGESARYEDAAVRAAGGWAARHAAGRAAVAVLTFVLPDLERAYNAIDAIAYQPMVFGEPEPVPDKVRWADAWALAAAAAVYTLVYVAALMLVGLALLRRREATA
jgi:hypothetical protein